MNSSVQYALAGAVAAIATVEGVPKFVENTNARAFATFAVPGAVLAYMAVTRGANAAMLALAGGAVAFGAWIVYKQRGATS